MHHIPEFGIKRENEERRDGGIGIVFDPQTGLYAVGRHTTDGFYRLFSGGVDPSEDTQEGTLREVTEESGLYDFSHIEKIGEAFAHYYNSLRNVNRVTKCTCFLIILESRDLKETKLEAHEQFSLAWVSAEELFVQWRSRNKDGDVDHWLYFLEKAVHRVRDLGYEAVRTSV